MNPKDKSVFQDALKEYDNKDYKKCKKSCDKVLSKNPSNQEALALKGLAELGLGDKVLAEKLIKESLSIGLKMKNSRVWQFYALFHKEQKNYAQAVKCYNFACKYDPDNLTIIKDLSNLLLFLGRYEDFSKYSMQCVTTKSSLSVNWVQYSLAEFFLGNYENSLHLIESVIKNFEDTMKKQELHEVILFKSNILFKLNKFDESIETLEKEIGKNCVDRVTFYEKIIKCCLKNKNVEKGVEYCKLALKINPENVFTYLNYFNLKVSGVNLTKYEDLFTLEENSEQRKNIYEILTKEIEPNLNKVKITEKMKLGLTSGDEFKILFSQYFLKSIKNNLPSFFNNIKFIYQYSQQKSKIPVIQEIITSNISEIESKHSLTKDILDLNKDNSMINIEPVFIWVYYFASQHFDIVGESEKAIEYINKAIKSTPTVVEFFMVKSKILKHNLLYEEASMAMGKAKDLDLSDRYLNAKHAKSIVRKGDVDGSADVMMEFVKNPLFEENMLRYQCLWFKVETGCAYLKQGKLLMAHRMFKGILDNFKEMNEDQNDFYNYSLRRYMLSDFYNLIINMKKMYKNPIVISSLFNLDLIRSGLQAKYKKNEKDLDKFKKQLEEEFKEAKEKGDVKLYTFTSYEELIKSIDNDLNEFLSIIQSLTKCPKVHYLCVKEFLLRNKPIKALKSYLILLKNENNNNFFSYKANCLFNQFLKDNEGKLNNEVSEFIKKKINEIDSKKFETFNNEGNSLEKIKYQLLNCENMFDENNEKSIEKLVEEIKKEEIRHSTSKLLNEVFTYISLYLGHEQLEKIQNKLREKVKMKFENYDEEIKGNLTLYQSEEEALKLFPDFRHKKSEKEKEGETKESEKSDK
jgi:peptide alpha-N-acetyltransferase